MSAHRARRNFERDYTLQVLNHSIRNLFVLYAYSNETSRIHKFDILPTKGKQATATNTCDENSLALFIKNVRRTSYCSQNIFKSFEELRRFCWGRMSDSSCHGQIRWRVGCKYWVQIYLSEIDTYYPTKIDEVYRSFIHRNKISSVRFLNIFVA